MVVLQAKIWPSWYPAEDMIEDVLEECGEISLPALAQTTGKSKSWLYRVLKKLKEQKKVQLTKRMTGAGNNRRKRLIVTGVS